MTPAVFAAYEKRMAVAQRRRYNDTQVQCMRMNGDTIKQIAKALHFAPLTIKRWVKRMGIQRR